MGWPCVVVVLGGPVVQYPWSQELGTSGISLLCYIVIPVESWLLLSHSSLGLTLRLADCESQPQTWHANCCMGADYSRVWFLLRSSFGHAACEAYWILCCCCLKLATGCFVSGSLGKNSGAGQFQKLLVTFLGNLFRATSDPQFVAAFSGHVCAQEGPSCTLRLAFTTTGLGRRSAKVPRHPEIFLCLPPTPSCLLGSDTERFSGGTLIAWGRFTVSHQVGACCCPMRGRCLLVFKGGGECGPCPRASQLSLPHIFP